MESLPEKERKAVAREVADRVLNTLKDEQAA